MIASFAVAQGTGLRWLGAVVLVVGGLWCAIRMLPVSGAVRTAVLAVVYVGAFVVSHPLGKVIGSWPAVLAVAIGTGLIAYLLMRPIGSRVSTADPPETSTR